MTIYEISDKIFEALAKLVGINFKKIEEQARASPTLVRAVEEDGAALKRLRAQYIQLDGKRHGSYEYPDLFAPFATGDGFGRTLGNKLHHDAKKLLHQSDEYMPTIRQFADFLKLIDSGIAHDGNGRKVDERILRRLFREITEVREPWRAERLDAYFESGTISYDIINADGTTTKVREELGDCLMSDKLPGLNLKSWLKTADYHGLPVAKTRAEKMSYLYPRDNSVAWFYADSGWAGLGCDGGPCCRDPSLWVRALRKKF